MKHILFLVILSFSTTLYAQTRWEHTIYRELDVNVDENAALYYPQEPVDGLTNFFTVLFNAFISGDLKAYEYLDGREVFDEKHLVKVEDVLNTHEIYYTKKADKKGNVAYFVEQGDIPCHLVTSFYIKEKWEFERISSQFQHHIVAICPVLHKLGDFGSEARYPLFWIDYSDLRPFIANELLMTAEMNTALRYSMDDYFTLSKYKGEIYKVQNPRGLTLQQQYPDPDTLKVKREEIEMRLKTFGTSIWIKPEEESVEAVSAHKSKTKNKVKSETALGSVSKAADVKTETKEETGESSKTENTTTRKSVRRNRRTGR